MEHFVEKVLSEELVEVKVMLERALAILDAHDGEEDAAYSVCEAIERLIGAPSTSEQWYMITGRNEDGSERG